MKKDTAKGFELFGEAFKPIEIESEASIALLELKEAAQELKDALLYAQAQEAAKALAEQAEEASIALQKQADEARTELEKQAATLPI